MNKFLFIAAVSILGLCSCLQKKYVCHCNDNKGNMIADTTLKNIGRDGADTDCMLREVSIEGPHTVGEQYDATCIIIQ